MTKKENWQQWRQNSFDYLNPSLSDYPLFDFLFLWSRNFSMNSWRFVGEDFLIYIYMCIIITRIVLSQFYIGILQLAMRILSMLLFVMKRKSMCEVDQSLSRAFSVDIRKSNCAYFLMKKIRCHSFQTVLGYTYSMSIWLRLVCVRRVFFNRRNRNNVSWHLETIILRKSDI